MKKVIKPSKQPTKKRSKRSTQRTQTAETAKLKIAIGKISTQLVNDHPKLIKGGGSLGITELLFSKILIKGGKLSLKTRGYIITFLKDIAPQVNKLKQELIRKLLEHLIDKKDIIDETNIYKNIIDINKEFVKDLYEYEIKDDIQDQIGNLSEEIKEYISILDIVKKYYILSRVKDDKEKASIKEEINNNKFQPLPSKILEALNNGNKKLLEGYFEKKKIDSGNGAPRKIEVVSDTTASITLQEEEDITEIGRRDSPHSSPRIGGNPAKYKSTGQVVYIMYKNKKYKRVIYVKDKRNTRYCKINKEYILLSKLKVIQLH